MRYKKNIRMDYREKLTVSMDEREIKQREIKTRKMMRDKIIINIDEKK